MIYAVSFLVERRKVPREKIFSRNRGLGAGIKAGWEKIQALKIALTVLRGSFLSRAVELV